MDKNRSFKLKLVVPCSFEYGGTPLHNPLPYGMGVLVAFLRKNNYYVEQEDLRIKFDYHKSHFFSLRGFRNFIYAFKFEEEIRSVFETRNSKCSLDLIIDKLLDSMRLDKFNLIGFSINSSAQFFSGLLLAKRIKQTKNIPIVFGGPFVTLFVNLYPEIFNWVDYAIVGDGRVPLAKLIEHLADKTAIAAVPNLIYQEDGDSKVNQRKRYSLEEVPVPDFDGLPLDLYKERWIRNNPVVFPYQLTRGCKGRCCFCVYKCIDDKLEAKSYDKVLAELRQMKKKYNSKFFYFCDDEINNSYEYLEGLCDLFIKNKLDIGWGAFARVANLDKHILKKIKQAGCYWLLLGIESGSNDTLIRMNKGSTAEEASKILRYATEAGLRNRTSFISGFPHETNEDTKKTVDFIRRNKRYIHSAVVFPFFLYYRSPIYCSPERYGVTNLMPSKPWRHFFVFDESGGLKCKQKQKQQKSSQEKINRAFNKYIITGFPGKNPYLFSKLKMKLRS